MKNVGRPKPKPKMKPTEAPATESAGKVSRKLKLVNGKIMTNNVSSEEMFQTASKVRVNLEDIDMTTRSKRQHTPRWSDEETDRFFEELEIHGECFDIIEH